MKLKIIQEIIQDLRCPKCGSKFGLKEVSQWNNKPYCDNCNTIWEMVVEPKKEYIRIEYKEEKE